MKRKSYAFRRAVGLLVLCPLLCACAAKPAEDPVLRVGIVSDVHIGFHSTYQQSERLEKVLTFFKNRGVDAVMIPGDLQDHWTTPQYDMADQIGWIEEFTDIWFRVFPDGKNDVTGQKIVPLFIYGNHDEDLCAEGYWPERLGQYQDAFATQIKGYWFVGAHYTREEEARELIHQAAAQAKQDGKPFFYMQHLPVQASVLGSGVGLKNTGTTVYEDIRDFDHAVVFSGHTHIPLTDERSIWQPGPKDASRFTAVNCATINYSWIASYTSMEINGIPDHTQQAMLMTVDGAQVTLERYSFYGDENVDGDPIGLPWSFDALAPEKPYGYDVRAAQAAAPEFDTDAQLEIVYVGDRFINVLIPAAQLTVPKGMSDMIHSYIVEAVDAETGQVVSYAEVASQHHIDSDISRLRGPYFVALEGLEPGRTYLLNAYARDFFQLRSDPICATVVTEAE